MKKSPLLFDFEIQRFPCGCILYPVYRYKLDTTEHIYMLMHGEIYNLRESKLLSDIYIIYKIYKVTDDGGPLLSEEPDDARGQDAGTCH